MTAPQDSPPGVDSSRPSPARVYDYLLGGDNNFESDRAAAELLRSRAPELVDSAYANRGFHQRAARWIAEHGVRLFIDIGSGLATVGNTHEVVRRVDPRARVVYVDNDRCNLGCTHAWRECNARYARVRARGAADVATAGAWRPTSERAAGTPASSSACSRRSRPRCQVPRPRRVSA